MTVKVVINHESDSLTDAYSVNQDEFATKVASTIEKFLEMPDGKLSTLGDVIQDNLTPNEILFLAQEAITTKLDQMEQDLENMQKLAKRFGL
jgi:hypothetical protein